MASVRGEVERLLRTLQANPYNCQVTNTNSNHCRISLPGKHPVFVSKSPSDKRAIRNIKSDLKRCLGIDI